MSTGQIEKYIAIAMTAMLAELEVHDATTAAGADPAQSAAFVQQPAA